MYNLKFLKFHDSGFDLYFDGPYNSKVHFVDGLSDLSGKLRSLICLGFPLTELPSNFNPENLIELDLRYSNLERLWEDTMTLQKLAQHSKYLKYLNYLNLRGCKSLRSLPSDIHFESIIRLALSDCDNLTKFPEISADLTELDLSGTAIDEVPPSIGSLTKLWGLNLSQCTRLKHISTNICKLKSLQWLNLKNCSGLESFPEIWETMEGLHMLELRGTAIKELPHNDLDLSDCSKLKILPDNLGNIKSLQELSIDRTAISQLPSTMMHLNELESLSCRGCRGLRLTRSSDFPCSLTDLYLSDCNLKEIPEDIRLLSSLLELDLSGNDFESLPKSMKQLSKLRHLKVNNCNMLQSLTEVPLSLELLSASDCQQLRSISEASELVNTEFIFTNCPKLEVTAVGNILATVEGYEGELDWFSFICPGSEVPEWFSYKSNESSIKFRAAWRDCFNGLLPEFIVCAVIEFEEYHGDGLYVDCGWTLSYGDESDPLTWSCDFDASRIETLIDSDHVAFWHCKALDHQVLKSEFTNCLIECWLSEDSPNCRVKSYGVRPIKISGVTIEEIGETSVKRLNLDRSP
ncbi:hypothetical protein Ddye_028083 [Dipteronia dyeriana]|uniref:Chaoptin n=1 Tax=Dipteronia dyeriana TaxID=168575 RepID=A0AAD9TQU7_9ROSI|nr:hypothetical protein Ddye_028083 [Dipteronia dyeriana]